MTVGVLFRQALIRVVGARVAELGAGLIEGDPHGGPGEDLTPK
jgi:hypothetical protein